MALLSFNINGNPDNRLEFKTKRMINAGYTGKNQQAVQKHIDELKELGIPAPGKIPVFFPKYPDRITQDRIIPCLDEEAHIGEAEYVLLFSGEEIYVAAGSDHTDRSLEQVSIPRAKQVYPNIISKDAWKLNDVEGRFDELVLHSYVENNGEKMLYQEATLGELLNPGELLEHLKDIIDLSDRDGLVIYSGTVAGSFEIDYSPFFEVAIKDLKRDMVLTCSYRFEPVKAWFKG